MKKILILSLLLVLCFCLPVLAAEEKVVGENATMVFKYKAFDNAKVGDNIVVFTVYDKETNQKITTDNYIYQGLTNQGVHLKKDKRGNWSPTSDIYLSLDQEGYAELKIPYIKEKAITFKLKPTEKKVYIFAIEE